MKYIATLQISDNDSQKTMFYVYVFDEPEVRFTETKVQTLDIFKVWPKSLYFLARLNLGFNPAF